MQRIPYRLILAALLATTIAGRAAAQETAFDPVARAKTITPFLDEQAFLVARVAPARVDPVKLIDRVVEVVPELKPQRTVMSLALGAAHAAVLQAGAKEFYAVLSIEEMDFHREPMPFLIVPAEGVNEEALSMLLATLPFEVKQRHGDVFFAGYRSVLERLKTITPDKRPEMTAAFEAAGDTAAQVLLLPPKYTARVIEEMMPELPLDGGPSTIVTHGVRWAALGVDTQELSVRLTVQSDDQEAAEALRRVWHGGLHELGEEKEVQEAVGDFEPFIRLFTPVVKGDRLVLELSDENGAVRRLIDASMVPLRELRYQARRTSTMNHLKQIGLALLNYQEVNKHLPAAASCDEDGKPQLSWRVHLLPYIEKGELYKQFHLDEPWDSEHNRTLIDQMPAIYRSPLSKLKEKGRTSYLAMVGGGAALSAREGTTLKQITDRTSSTFMVVEVADQEAVVWTKPEDLEFDPNEPAKALGGLHQDGFLALACDGSVQWVKLPLPAETLRALFTRAGGEKIKHGDF